MQWLSFSEPFSEECKDGQRAGESFTQADGEECRQRHANVLAVGRVWERRFNQTNVCNRTDLSKCTVLQDDASCDKQFHIPDQKSQKQNSSAVDKHILRSYAYCTLCIVFLDNMRHKRPVAPFNVNFFKSTTFRGNILGLPRGFLANMLL